MKIVKWLKQHCFKDKEKWFGKRYINIEYDLFDVVYWCVVCCIYFIVLFICIYTGGNSLLIAFILAFGSVLVLLGYGYLDILFNHFVKNKHKKD